MLYWDVMIYIRFLPSRGPIPNLKYQKAKKINFVACVHGGIVHAKAELKKRVLLEHVSDKENSWI